MKPRHVLLFFTLLIAFVFAGCATKPSTQWWRVGNCLVVYDQTKEEKQIVAVGQGCDIRSEEHTSELQSQSNLVCRLLLEKKKNRKRVNHAEWRRVRRRAEGRELYLYPV